MLFIVLQTWLYYHIWCALVYCYCVVIRIYMLLLVDYRLLVLNSGLWWFYGDNSCK